MNIEISLKDKEGRELNLGDEIAIYDWNRSNDLIGEGILVFEDGELTTEPPLVGDTYDFFNKALPNCLKI